MDKNNKMVYKCAICGKVYDKIEDRIKCEQECLRKQQEEEKAAAEAKKKAEKETDFVEASKAIDNAYTLVKKCVEDYGMFKYSGKLKDLDALNLDFFPSKLWHHFWF